MTLLPLVSIVTPSYNQAAFLEATIRSVLEQDYGHIEYLIMDGGSTDGSAEIIQRYADRLAGWESARDGGQAAAINKGLRQASGAILGWLNSDDVLLPDTVRRVVETFQRHPDVDVVYGRLNRIDSRGEAVPTPTLPKDRVVFGPANAIGECVVNQPGSFWRRTIMERAGLLDEAMHFALDYELWVRYLKAGARFHRLDAAVAEFRLSDDSKTVGQTARAAQEHLALLDRLAADHSLAAALHLTPRQVALQARRGKALLSLYVFYGLLKKRQFNAALPWLASAVAHYPPILLNARWPNLALARLQRTRREKRGERRD